MNSHQQSWWINLDLVQSAVDALVTLWYSKVMNRQHTALHRTLDCKNNDYVPGSPAERISLVWPLTREVVSLGKRYDAERRLQRDVARIVRREG